MKVISGREKDLGGFNVRRILPFATHRMVGPFIFLDHMGPSQFLPGKGIDVRPHPHIGLSTVTYLFEGKIHHRDSLGNDQLIEPGAINWMTAGKGIVHSERSPEQERRAGDRLNGLQCWVALPTESEEVEPNFKHHPSRTLPQFEDQGVKLKLLVGEAMGHRSPAKVYSDMFYIEAKIPADKEWKFSSGQREAAVYVVDGKVEVNGQSVSPYDLVISENYEDLVIKSHGPSLVMLLGGKPVGERIIFWNFVSSTQDKIESAKFDWQSGPKLGARFSIVPGDDKEFIPLS